MKKLETQFTGTRTQKGWNFQLIKRTKSKAMYSKTNNGIKYFEVFNIEIQKEHTSIIKGITIEYKEKELYPTDERFGYSAWCYRSIHKADLKFSSI